MKDIFIYICGITTGVIAEKKFNVASAAIKLARKGFVVLKEKINEAVEKTNENVEELNDAKEAEN